MIRYFRKTMILLLPLCVLTYGVMFYLNGWAGMIIGVFTNPNGSGDPFLFSFGFLYYVLPMFSILVAATITHKLAVKMHENLLNILYRDYNPAEFIRRYKPLTGRKFHGAKSRSLVRSNLALGYAANGEIEKAIAIQEAISSETGPSRHAPLFIVSQYNLVLLHLDLGESEKAHDYYQTAKSAQEKLDPTERYDKCYYELSDEIENRFEVLAGRYAAPLSYFERMLKKSVNEYQRSRAQFQLADLHNRMKEGTHGTAE